jgi:hypothetical protein
MVLDLVNSFNSEEMRRNRALFAKRLLEVPNSIDVAKNTPVLEFFEEVGYMTRRGVLDEGMVWNSFSWWFEPYYLAVRGSPDLIAEARSRTKAPSLFCEIEWLNGRMREISMRADKRSPPANDVLEMLTEEVRLAEPAASVASPRP